MSTSAGVVDGQLAELRRLYHGAEAVMRPDGTVLIRVPAVSVPAGWNKAASSFTFIVPVGYPVARPDCFWADADLRLAGGAMPANAGVQAIPGTTESALWFSWHVNSWDPARDTLVTYVRVMRERLARVR